MTSKSTVEEVWKAFWEPILIKKDGSINIKQLKKELYDFSFVMEQASKVYCHITDGRISKVTTYATVVIAIADAVADEEISRQINKYQESK